jgi:hypothetical protein
LRQIAFRVRHFVYFVCTLRRNRRSACDKLVGQHELARTDRGERQPRLAKTGYFNQHVVAVDADQRSRELLTTVQLFLHADPGLMPGPVGEILQTR